VFTKKQTKLQKWTKNNPFIFFIILMKNVQLKCCAFFQLNVLSEFSKNFLLIISVEEKYILCEQNKIGHF